MKKEEEEEDEKQELKIAEGFRRINRFLTQLSNEERNEVMAFIIADTAQWFVFKCYPMGKTIFDILKMIRADIARSFFLIIEKWGSGNPPK